MNRGVHRVIYDDGCAYCVRQMRRVQRLDWGRRFRAVPRSSPEAAALGLAPSALATAIHCVTRDGRVLRGAACLRFVGLRLPLVAPLAALLWLPGALRLAGRVYEWISRRRHRLGAIASRPSGGAPPGGAAPPVCRKDAAQSEGLPGHAAGRPGPCELR